MRSIAGCFVVSILIDGRSPSLSRRLCSARAFGGSRSRFFYRPGCLLPCQAFAVFRPGPIAGDRRSLAILGAAARPVFEFLAASWSRCLPAHRVIEASGWRASRQSAGQAGADDCSAGWCLVELVPPGGGCWSVGQVAGRPGPTVGLACSLTVGLGGPEGALPVFESLVGRV